MVRVLLLVKGAEDGTRYLYATSVCVDFGLVNAARKDRASWPSGSSSSYQEQILQVDYSSNMYVPQIRKAHASTHRATLI